MPGCGVLRGGQGRCHDFISQIDLFEFFSGQLFKVIVADDMIRVTGLDLFPVGLMGLGQIGGGIYFQYLK